MKHQTRQISPATKLLPPIFIFLFLAISRSSSTPLQLKTLILASLQHTQTPLEDPQSQIQFESDYESPLALTLLHVNAISTRLNYSPEALFNLRLGQDAVRVKALMAYADASTPNASSNHRAPEDFSSSVSSGLAQGSCEYFTRIGVGTPPKYVYMVLDTGSDVVWIQCSPCMKCYLQSDPVFDPKSSSSFLGVMCGSPLCRSLDSPSCNGRQKCVSYGDRAFTAGEFSTETLTFQKKKVGNIALGCGHVTIRKIVT